MGYMDELEANLRRILDAVPGKGRDAIIRLMKEEVLRSYKNGLAAGRRGGKKAPPAK
jgi:hypothetical protein